MTKKRSLTIGWNNWNDLSTGVQSKSTCFAFVDMGAVITDDGIRWLLEVCTYGQLIGHCTRGEKQGGFLPKQSRHVCFKSSSIGFMINVVSKRGLNGVLVHLLGGN